jgi:hypothetical protein
LHVVENVVAGTRGQGPLFGHTNDHFELYALAYDVSLQRLITESSASCKVSD